MGNQERYVFQKEGVSAVLGASGHIGKNKEMVIKFAPRKSLVPLTSAISKGQ